MKKDASSLKGERKEAFLRLDLGLTKYLHQQHHRKLP